MKKENTKFLKNKREKLYLNPVLITRVYRKPGIIII